MKDHLEEYISQEVYVQISVIKGKEKVSTKSAIIKYLNRNNIEIRPLWKPMNLQPILKHYRYFGEGIEQEIFNKGFCLPSGSNLSNLDKKKIHSKFSKILNT